jgi:hypothetical protein
VLPVGYTLRAYSACLFIHELRGDRADASRYLDLITQFVASHPASSSLDRDASLALAARALAHGGRAGDGERLFDSAMSVHAPPTLEALCEIVAAQEDWERAPDVIASARRQAEISEAVALPLFADRLEGRLRAAEGEPLRAAQLLRRSAAGYAELGAQWEEGWTREILAEALIGLGDEQEARAAVEAARAVFERLGSVVEHEHAKALAGTVA